MYDNLKYLQNFFIKSQKYFTECLIWIATKSKHPNLIPNIADNNS